MDSAARIKDSIGRRSVSEEVSSQQVAYRRHLGLWDAVSIIVGIVLGAGIYETAPIVFESSGSGLLSLGLWVVGGLLSLIGALCYAEVASTYPLLGGDYAYLKRAFGSFTGFMFGWIQLALLLTGSIGMLAFIFAEYASTLFSGSGIAELNYALVALAALTLSNIVGIKIGRRTQNALTLLSLAGVLLVTLTGFFLSLGSEGTRPSMELTGGSTSAAAIGIALIMILYTYGGWNDAAFIAPEIDRKRTNIPKVFILGTAAISVVYVLVNISYLFGLGFEGASSSRAIAAELLGKQFGRGGSAFMSLVVMISVLASMNALILTGSRIYSALGRDHSAFAFLARWDERRASPVRSITIQSVIRQRRLRHLNEMLGSLVLVIFLDDRYLSFRFEAEG